MKRFVNFLQVLGLRTTYFNHNLDNDGIVCAGEKVTEAQKVVNTFQPSLVIGADGRFSTVRRNQLPEDLVHYNANMIIHNSTIDVERSVYDSEIAPYLNEFLAASIKYENCQLEAQSMTIGDIKARMNLTFSKLSVSDEDFHAFYGLQPHQRDIKYSSMDFDESIIIDISRFGTLSKPFDILFERAKLLTSLSVKVLPTAIRQEQTDLAGAVYAGQETVPAVLIGSAAHSLPRVNDSDYLSHKVLDAFQVIDIISAAWYASKNAVRRSPALFASVAQLFYERAAPRWQKAEKEWEERLGTKVKWTLVKSVKRRPFPPLSIITPSQIEDLVKVYGPFQELLAAEQNRWVEREQTRRKKVESRDTRLRMRTTQNMAPKEDKSVKPKLVLRYSPTMV